MFIVDHHVGVGAGSVLTVDDHVGVGAGSMLTVDHHDVLALC